MFLLGRRVLPGPAVDVWHAEVLQGRPGTSEPRHAGHHSLVHRLREPLRRVAGPVANVPPVPVHQLPQRLTPRTAVRRVDQDTVDIEDPTLETHRGNFLSLAIQPR